ncbi:MAG TPA: ubiquinone/menaquinone biosynthesis methyltransferase [Candidatus Binatus sp.]|nr:ubiquinone/menaquinone biosynthesis methyltransferase [Candidatus Binatus sp.]
MTATPSRDPGTPSGHAGDRGNGASAGEVGAMFDRIAPRYDLMNALISGFQEPRWRRRAIAATGLRPGMTAIDVATGTGKVARGLADRVGPFGRVVGVDVSTVMLDRARRANADRVELAFVVGDALDLPIEDGIADAATIAFGMRNLPDYERGFREMLRVVRPGGRVVCLEAARARSLPGRLGWLWFEHVVPMLGRLAGHAAPYRYLVTSVAAYPAPEQIAEIMRRAGWADVRWVPLTVGLVTIHTGRRRADPPA